MDLNSTIVGIIMLAICSSPFILMVISRKKREKIVLLSLKEIAKQHASQISHYEFCGNFVLGIDENNNHLFFLNQKKEETISQFVNLSEIKSCAVVKKTREFKNKSKQNLIIERIELNFKQKNATQMETTFEVYDESENMQLSGELQFVEKWSTLINGRLQ